MALVAEPRAKPAAGIRAIRQDRPRDAKRAAARRTGPFDRLHRVAARPAAELLAAARRRREVPAAMSASLPVPFCGSCAAPSLQRRSCSAHPAPRCGVVGPHLIDLAARGAGAKAGRAIPGLGARQHGSDARRRAGCERHGGQGSSVGWMPMASGLRMPCRTPHGVQRLPAVSGRKASVHWCLRSARVAPASGWLPKKPALTLAKSRASPASIRFRPERNRKTMG